MRKVVFSIVMMLAVSVSFAQDIDVPQERGAVKTPSGYQGFIDQGPALRFMEDWKSSISFSTTHGFYFNGNTYVGVGVSFEGNNDMFVMPLYTALKYNFTYNKKLTPTVQIRVGSYVGNNVGTYGDFSFGFRFGSSRDFAINVMAAASFFSNYKSYVREWDSAEQVYVHYNKTINPSSLALRIGIEW